MSKLLCLALREPWEGVAECDKRHLGAWPPGCLAARPPGRLAAAPPGRKAAWLPGCLDGYPNAELHPAAVRCDMVLRQAFRGRRVRKNGIGGEVRHGVTSDTSCETSKT